MRWGDVLGAGIVGTDAGGAGNGNAGNVSVIFTLGSLAAAFAFTLPQLLTARLLPD